MISRQRHLHKMFQAQSKATYRKNWQIIRNEKLFYSWRVSCCQHWNKGKDMIPLRVSLEGFLSYKDKQIIDFEGSSLWMLCGPNGVGKSAVFDAITFALYGYHRAGGGNPKALINHYANDNRFIVEFDFFVDGIAFRIRRTCARHVRSTR